MGTKSSKPNFNDLKPKPADDNHTSNGVQSLEEQALERIKEEKMKEDFKNGAQYVANTSAPAEDPRIPKNFSIPQSLDHHIDELATLVPKGNRSDVVITAIKFLSSLDTPEIRKLMVSNKLK